MNIAKTSDAVSFSRTLLLLTLLLMSAASESSAEGRKLKIGVSTALTGEAAASYGQDVSDFLQFANREFGGGRYELIFEDDRCAGAAAAAAANKLVNVDKVDAVIGFPCSGATLSALPIYEKAGIPTMVLVASSPKIADAGPNVFRTFPSDARAAADLFAEAAKAHKRIAVLSEETDYAQDFKHAFAAAASKAPDVTLLEEDYAPGTSDFRSVLLRLRGKKPDALFINTQAEPTFAVVLTELERMGWQLPRYGAYWPGSKSLQEVAGKSLDGIVFVDLPNLDDVLGSDGKDLLARYRKQGGKIRSIETSFATAIEGFRALDQALQAKEKSAVAFLASTEFKGMFGPYHFDDRGEIEGLSFALKVIRDGQAQSLH